MLWGMFLFILMYIKKIPNKASLSFGRTSAGIVWCFWGMFHTIATTTMEYLIAELARNLMNWGLSETIGALLVSLPDYEFCN